jgi:hypothetical protein
MSLFSKLSVHRSPVLLTGSTTWDAWYALIKNTATLQGNWQYVNPETPTADLPAIQEPIAPAVARAVDGAQNPIDLYRIRYQVYITEMVKYKAVQHFMLRIQKSLAADVLSHTL